MRKGQAQVSRLRQAAGLCGPGIRIPKSDAFTGSYSLNIEKARDNTFYTLQRFKPQHAGFGRRLGVYPPQEEGAVASETSVQVGAAKRVQR